MGERVIADVVAGRDDASGPFPRFCGTTIVADEVLADEEKCRSDLVIVQDAKQRWSRLGERTVIKGKRDETPPVPVRVRRAFGDEPGTLRAVLWVELRPRPCGVRNRCGVDGGWIVL